MRQNKEKQRLEKDSLGEVYIAEEALWGAQTQRALENFQVSKEKIPRQMLSALAYIKEGAAWVNFKQGRLEEKYYQAIAKVCGEIRKGRLDDHFPLDVFQTGSGTSWNMNINEVIANAVNQEFDQAKGSKKPLHPNDHINMGQSSNDVIPSAISMANRFALSLLLESLTSIIACLKLKEQEFKDIVKLGRTHLQDAVPMTLGQEFSAWRVQLEKVQTELSSFKKELEELVLGGTAIGSGLNCFPDFDKEICAYLKEKSGINFYPAENKFRGISSRDQQVMLMGQLNSLAVILMKLAQDLRLLSSGPRSGLAEIKLKALQPGSSIMPGKVNPVIPEMVIQAAASVMGKHLSVTIAGQNAPLQLNIMLPLIAFETLYSLELLEKTINSLEKKCLCFIEADRGQCLEALEWSLALITPLAVKIGYDKAAQLAKEAYLKKKKIRDLVLEENLLEKEELDKIMDPLSMCGKD